MKKLFILSLVFILTLSSLAFAKSRVTIQANHINYKDGENSLVAENGISVIVDEIEIKSESAKINTKTNRATFTGMVEILKKASKENGEPALIKTEAVDINLETKDFEIVGKVEIFQGERIFQATSARYQDLTKEIALSGNVRIEEPDQTLIANTCLLYPETSEFIAQGEVEIELWIGN